MSYILDALKKSESERNRGVTPSLFAGHQDQLKSRVGAWVLGGALLINACFAGYWLYSRQNAAAPNEPSIIATPQLQPQQQPPPLPQPQPIPAPVAAEQPVAAVQPTPSPLSLPTSRTNIPTVSTPVADVVPRSAAPPRPTSNEMELANLSFSTHVYASDPTKRAVTLNGRRLTEGDSISKGVVIKEITETGVILEVNGREVPLEVLQDWH